MIQINADEIGSALPDYLRRVETGETLILMRAGKPIAQMTPIETPSQTPRPFGLCAGEFNVPDDFDAPLPDDILDAFEGR